MEAFGSDRVRIATDGRILLFSRLSKGWKGRVEKTRTTAEFPGTTVLWDDVHYEVLSVNPVPEGGVRYMLIPWSDHHAMRVVDRYDAESEAHRIEEHAKAVRRERGRFSANVLGIFTGHLPAAVQNALAYELGVLPTRLTLISMILPFAFVISAAMLHVQNILVGKPTPFGLTLATGYVMAEIGVRIYVAMMQARPLGSTAGLFAYMIFYALAPNRSKLISPFHVEKGYATPITDAPPDVARRDSFMMREAYVTLLSPEEQARALALYDYDYRKHSYKVAALILVFAALGVYTSVSSGAVLSGLIALALAVEQVARLRALRRGPAPSVLGWVVRPFVRKLLA
jgi:hypothetical protein